MSLLSANVVVSAQNQQYTEIWSLPTDVIDLDVSKDGSRIVYVNSSGIYCLDAETSELLWSNEIPAELSAIYFQVAISADGSGAVVLFQQFEPQIMGLVYFNRTGHNRWSISLPGMTDYFPFLEGSTAKLVDISDDGEYVTAAFNNETEATLLYWDESSTSTGNPAPTWSSGDESPPVITCLDTSDDGGLVAIGTDVSEYAYVYFYLNARSISGPSGPTSGITSLTSKVNDIAVSHDGYAATAVTQGVDDYNQTTLYYWSDVPSLSEESPANWTRQHPFHCVDMNAEGDIVAAGTPELLPCGVHYWADSLGVNGVFDRAEEWTTHTGEFIPDIALSRSGDILAATSISEGENMVYFHDAQGNSLGEFQVSSEDILLEMSGDGAISAVGGSAIGSLHVYKQGGEPEPMPVGGTMIPSQSYLWVTAALALISLTTLSKNN